jgi:protein-tyrosine phosphatase
MEDRMLTDLHCHILPGIDDGAQTSAIARKLLEEEKKQETGQIMFTPHYYSWMGSAEDFREKRDKAAEITAPILKELGISWNTGAEVRMTPRILQEDLQCLVFGSSEYLLLEWPFVAYPDFGRNETEYLMRNGLKLIFAHIERYDWFWNHPDILAQYISKGVLCQINTGTVIRRDTRRKALRYIREGYVHILSSDAHNMDERPPKLKEAYDIVEKKLGTSAKQKLLDNADAVFNGRDIPICFPEEDRSGLFG